MKLEQASSNQGEPHPAQTSFNQFFIEPIWLFASLSFKIFADSVNHTGLNLQNPFERVW